MSSCTAARRAAVRSPRALASGRGQRDVVGDRRGEQERLLRHPADRVAQGVKRVVVAARCPPQATRPASGAWCRSSSAQQRRLAGAGRADQAQRLARAPAQRHVGQRRLRLAAVVKATCSSAADPAATLRAACRGRRPLSGASSIGCRRAQRGACRVRSATAPSRPRTSARSAGPGTC